MNRKWLAPTAAIAALALLALLGAIPAGALGGAHASSTHTVTLSGVSFHPSTLTINRGDTVKWSWHIPKSEHNVTFHSVHSRTGSSGSLSVRFTHAGTFPYICTVHVNKGMKGKVIVR
jgi:plastocyanin